MECICCAWSTGWGPGAPVTPFIQGTGWDCQPCIQNKPLSKPAQEHLGLKPRKSATNYLQTPNSDKMSYLSWLKMLGDKSIKTPLADSPIPCPHTHFLILFSTSLFGSHHLYEFGYRKHHVNGERKASPAIPSLPYLQKGNESSSSSFSNVQWDKHSSGKEQGMFALQALVSIQGIFDAVNLPPARGCLAGMRKKHLSHI